MRTDPHTCELARNWGGIRKRQVRRPVRIRIIVQNSHNV
jgi:hypothetical protein